MKTIFDLQTGVVTLLCTAALAGLTACEADPVMQESGKLPDKGSIEEVHVMLCSSNSVENRVDVLLTELLLEADTAGGSGIFARRMVRCIFAQ